MPGRGWVQVQASPGVKIVGLTKLVPALSGEGFRKVKDGEATVTYEVYISSKKLHEMVVKAVGNGRWMAVSGPVRVRITSSQRRTA